ncbi:DNA-binding response regulator [Lactobacillus selangorensis]|uniref:DNA-binding response regulator n=1 Tax=Lactobacillus selangorensis TaxID=81857 RepID=A0A0R2FUP3_9LACO|nr:response regulator transcription factor [Lactobacillus selangorensis]KRN28476.1 DNA-binding response regulator [Lactobacillus selangorensis]KRN31976.1 DNA-binding response regulator [Lactobacillus selangorensis]
MKRILVVDDEPAIVKLLQYNLEREYYQVEVAYDGQTAYEMATTEPFDFIILDLMLPQMDGIEVTKKLRHADINTPIMILTAKDSETDKIIGLEMGADDYVTKPFSPREIVARIKAIERRVHKPAAEKAPTVKIGDLVIDEQAIKVTRGDQKLHLTPKEFELLVFFAERVGQVLSRETLLNGVWGFDYPAETRMVDIQVSHLRDKIEPDPKHPHYIQTIRGFGYRMEAPLNVAQ